MALEDDIAAILLQYDEDRSAIARLVADLQYVRKMGFTVPATNVNTQGAAINTALRTARRNAQDAMRLIRADIEALIDA